jgi:hypothetical protein
LNRRQTSAKLPDRSTAVPRSKSGRVGFSVSIIMCQSSARRKSRSILGGRKCAYAKTADENVMHGQNPKIMLPIRPVPYGSGNLRLGFAMGFPASNTSPISAIRGVCQGLSAHVPDGGDKVGSSFAAHKLRTRRSEVPVGLSFAAHMTPIAVTRRICQWYFP